MWLSVVDFADKAELEELQQYARAMFYDTFKWEDLETTGVGAKKEE